MGFKLALLAAGLLLGSADARASSCDVFARRADTAAGESLVQAYKRLTQCDKDLASGSYERFMRRAGDLETLVPLTLMAVDAEIYVPLWKLMDRLPYDIQGSLAGAVGEQCATHPNVGTFLKGAYAGLKGADFNRWQPALTSCAQPELVTWLGTMVEDPPASSYNEKYNAVLTAWTKHKRLDGIPALESAAVKAGTEGGPFNNILDALHSTSQPASFSAEMPAANRAAMEEALVRIANAVPSDQARVVADRLLTAGADGVAATLMPAIYRDRIQPDGSLLWGAAAVERCDGQAVLHWAAVAQPADHIDVTGTVTEPLRSTKPRLKCTSDEPWLVIASGEPQSDYGAVASWVEALTAEWAARDLDVKLREEKKAIR